MSQTRYFLCKDRSSYGFINVLDKKETFQETIDRSADKIRLSGPGVSFTGIYVKADSIKEAWEIFIDWFYDKRFEDDSWMPDRVAGNFFNTDDDDRTLALFYRRPEDIYMPGIKQLPKKKLKNNFCFISEHNIVDGENIVCMGLSDWNSLIYFSADGWCVKGGPEYWSDPLSDIDYSSISTYVLTGEKGAEALKKAVKDNTSKFMAKNYQNKSINQFKNYNNKNFKQVPKWNNKRFR